MRRLLAIRDRVVDAVRPLPAEEIDLVRARSRSRPTQGAEVTAWLLDGDA